MEAIQRHIESATSKGPLAAPRQPSRQLLFHGNGSTLFGIYMVNLLLTILTLGINYFWGKMKVRRYVLGQVEFEGDRFAYHATDQEPLVEWLNVILIFGLLYGAQSAAAMSGSELIAGAVQIAVSLTLLILILIPIAIVGFYRLHLSRISWRGIRFSFRGRARDFLKIYLAGLLLLAITFGLYYPFYKNGTHKFLVRHSYFGTTQFDYDGQGGDLLKPYLLALGCSLLVAPIVGFDLSVFLPKPVGLVLGGLVALVILGASWLEFTAMQSRYYWAHTSFATARFRSTVTATRLLRLFAGNGLLLVFTFGLALPWAQIRQLRFTFANLFLDGPLDLEAIRQEAQAAFAVGDEMADFLGIPHFDLGL